MSHTYNLRSRKVSPQVVSVPQVAPQVNLADMNKSQYYAYITSLLAPKGVYLPPDKLLYLFIVSADFFVKFPEVEFSHARFATVVIEKMEEAEGAARYSDIKPQISQLKSRVSAELNMIAPVLKKSQDEKPAVFQAISELAKEEEFLIRQIQSCQERLSEIKSALGNSATVV